MAETNLIVHLLIKEIDRSKAVIKYETKQLNYCLERIVDLLESGALKPVMQEKPPVMWLDAIFQSAVKSWRFNAAKQIISHQKKYLPTVNKKLERLFNTIDSLQELAFCDKNAADN